MCAGVVLAELACLEQHVRAAPEHAPQMPCQPRLTNTARGIRYLNSVSPVCNANVC